MTENQPVRLSVNQAALKWHVHPNTIRNLIKSGKLPAVRLGARLIRITESDLDALFTPYKGGEFGIWSR